jgi:hypothetical protein
VLAALESRRVRALDLLLVAPVEGEPMRYDDAVAHCKMLDEAGHRGWRLPSGDELVRLGLAGVIPKASWWWAARAKKRPLARVVWDGDSAHRRNASRATVAGVVCVIEDRGSA